MLVETVNGDHYQMGFEEGRAFRHIIHALVHCFRRHSFDPVEKTHELEPQLRLMRDAEEALCPWVFEEMKGVAAGAEMDLLWVRRIHYRIWNYVPEVKPEPPSACTAVGMLSAKDGVVVGGNLDDPRFMYYLIRRRPERGIPHLMAAWPGAGWGHNGMNAEGLCVAQASLGSYSRRLVDEGAPRLLASMLTRLILQSCGTVPEALDLLRRVKGESNLVIGDKHGNLVSCQCVYGLEPVVQHPAECGGMVFSTNHVHMAELVQTMKDKNIEIAVPEQSALRFSAAAELRASTADRSLAQMKALLRSHKHYPHSICRDESALSMVCAPEQEPGAVYFADRPPCATEYQRYDIVGGTP